MVPGPSPVFATAELAVRPATLTVSTTGAAAVFSATWANLARAVHSRRSELFLTLGLAALAMLLSSTLLYWAEGEAQPDKFGSIPRAFWWAVVTLTTVGYGDVFPITVLGKVFAAGVAFSGIGLIALPTSILAAAFSEVMQGARATVRNSDEAELDDTSEP